MILRFVNGRVVTAAGVLDGADLALDGESVSALSASGAARPDQVVDLEGGWLLPGFIDTQVNGGGGVLFNDHVEVDAIAAIGAAHAQFGTTAFLPTLISDTPAQIAAALDAVDAAIDRGVPGVVGVHIEGPFINEAKRGIHEARQIRALDDEVLSLLTRRRRGRVMLTLAPELCAEAHVRALARAGVILSVGHSNASHEAARDAFAAGVGGVTHLFNAMSPLHHRNPGVVGAALESDAYCGLIADGVHVHPAVLRLAARLKGPDRIMLVTDAMPSVGTGECSFVLQGKRIEVRDGVCMFEDGTLAGAHLDMAAAVRNMVAMTGLGVPEVSTMASGTPAQFLSIGDRHGTIAPAQRADWAWLDADLAPRGTWIGGISSAEAAAAPLAVGA